MSTKNDVNTNNNPLPDYLDVSSEEEPNKNFTNINNKPPKEDYSSNSSKSKEKYYENYNYNKYYPKNKRHKSRSRNRHRHLSRSRSRSYHHGNKRHHKRGESNSSNSYSKERNKYRYYDKNKNTRSRNDSYSSSYDKDKYRHKKSHNHNYNYSSISRNNSSRNSSYKKNLKDKKEKKEDNIINNNISINKENKINKWSEGDKKLDFKQIKVEKYSKNKNKDNIYKSKEKEISQLKKDLIEKKEEKIIEKEKPDFNPSGILQKDLEFEYNKSMNNKILINYNPPSDSIIPEENVIWFLFKFSEDKKEAEETFKLINKEFFLIGKDPRICDIRIKQQNISRQHAVIQFRKIRKEKTWEILPYLIDLNSTNGTYLNGDKIDNKKYYELRDKDELNFGDKKLDFVLMKMK